MKNFDRLFFFSLLLTITQISFVTAATYYISAKSGDDMRTALQVQNQSTPWKSSSKIMGLALGAGDEVLFERGQSYRGSVQLGRGTTVAGLMGNNVTIGAYGTGEVPVLMGAKGVSSPWTKY